MILPIVNISPVGSGLIRMFAPPICSWSQSGSTAISFNDGRVCFGIAPRRKEGRHASTIPQIGSRPTIALHRGQTKLRPVLRENGRTRLVAPSIGVSHYGSIITPVNAKRLLELLQQPSALLNLWSRDQNANSIDANGIQNPYGPGHNQDFGSYRLADGT